MKERETSGGSVRGEPTCEIKKLGGGKHKKEKTNETSKTQRRKRAKKGKTRGKKAPKQEEGEGKRET